MEKDESKMSFFARTDPESRAKMAKGWSEGGKKSGQTRRNKGEIKRMLENMGDVRDGAIAAYLEKNPEAIDQLYAQVFELALSGEKWAAELVINSTGLAAPKKTEVKTEEVEVSEDELIARLMEKQNGNAQ